MTSSAFKDCTAIFLELIDIFGIEFNVPEPSRRNGIFIVELNPFLSLRGV
jgi:hypothetical protein